MQNEKIQIASSRRVGMRDINALLQTAPISRIKTLRDDEGRSKNVGQVLPDNEGNLIQNNSCVVGSEQLHLRTSALSNKGFTLIELLVVVLIIGILAAIALPQYQKAVLKSRNNTLKTFVTSIATAQHAYYLETGNYASSFAQLDLDLPLKKDTSINRQRDGVLFAKVCDLAMKSRDALRTGEDFHVLLNSTDETKSMSIVAYWTKGKYSCNGFRISLPNYTALYCWESTNGLAKNAKGSFCESIEGGTLISQRNYKLP